MVGLVMARWHRGIGYVGPCPLVQGEEGQQEARHEYGKRDLGDGEIK
jgi:hypothetical protein